MKSRTPGLGIAVLVLSAACLPSVGGAAQDAPIARRSLSDQRANAMAEDAIRQRIDDYGKAIRARDLNGVMSLYAPRIVSFDLNPPLRYSGTENKRRAWQEFFAAYAGQIGYDITELDITTDGQLGFVHSLNHVTGTLPHGHKADLWVRWTACFQYLDGAWRVVHDHVSVPADLKQDRAAVDLKP